MSGPIVAATDFSARADRAVDRAFMLGSQLSRPVELVHAIEYAPGRNIDMEKLDSQMRAVLPATDVPVTFAYPEGSVPAAIANHSEEVGASMLVLGVARYNSVGDYILGTAVDRIIRGTSKPVIVVKKRPRKPYGKVLVATDFSPFSLEALSWAVETFPDCELHVLHAYYVPFQAWNKAPWVAEEIEKEAQDRLATLKDELPPETADRLICRVVKGSLCNAINTQIDKLGIDLVAIGSQGETGFRHATIGSQASSVLEDSHADTVLIGPRVA